MNEKMTNRQKLGGTIFLAFFISLISSIVLFILEKILHIYIPDWLWNTDGIITFYWASGAFLLSTWIIIWKGETEI